MAFIQHKVIYNLYIGTINDIVRGKSFVYGSDLCHCANAKIFSLAIEIISIQLSFSNDKLSGSMYANFAIMCGVWWIADIMVVLADLFLKFAIPIFAYAYH